MKCFNNGLPTLSSNDRTNNTKAQTIFTHNKAVHEGGIGRNYKASVYYDTTGVKKTQSYNILGMLAKGRAICKDCPADAITLWPTKLDTHNGPELIMELENPNLVDESCNVITNIECHKEQMFDAAGNPDGWGLKAPGKASIIDPNDVHFGSKQYLDFVSLERLASEKTQENYLRFLSYPHSKITF